jgi:hypothetical protein
LVRAYQLVGYTPRTDYSFLEINRYLRGRHPEIVQEVITRLTAMGVAVERDPATQMLILDHELTVSLVLSRCLRTETGSSRWMLRFEESFRPDLIGERDVVSAWLNQDTDGGALNLKGGFLGFAHGDAVGSGGCGGAVVEDEPGDEIEGSFVFLRLLLNQGDDEVATALEAGGELLLEGGGDRLDGGGEQCLHAARRAGDGGDRREADAGGIESIEHCVEPLEGISPRPGGEIGQRDVRIRSESDVNEAVEAAFGADVEFLC